MWIYESSSGRMSREGDLLADGYSGALEAKNDPTRQDEKNVGPIPEGIYRIGDPVDTHTHGPFVLPLTPDVANNMFNRSGFLIHGDSVVHPGMASEGCIILPRFARERIAESGDRELQVVAKLVDI